MNLGLSNGSFHALHDNVPHVDKTALLHTHDLRGVKLVAGGALPPPPR